MNGMYNIFVLTSILCISVVSSNIFDLNDDDTSEIVSTVDVDQPLCKNNRSFEFLYETRKLDCADIQYVEERRVELCVIDEVIKNCPISCGVCCEDDEEYMFRRDNDMMSGCRWLTKNYANRESRLETYCDTYNNGMMVRSACPKSCGYCKSYIAPSPSTFPTMTLQPSQHPSLDPTTSPSSVPSLVPSSKPTLLASEGPSTEPSSTPSDLPTFSPTLLASSNPSSVPSSIPSTLPSLSPSDQPSSIPSSLPSASPSSMPSTFPSPFPSEVKSESPSESSIPSSEPSILPTYHPSFNPSSFPSDIPSNSPSDSVAPTNFPSSSSSPSNIPTISPSVSNGPSPNPSTAPSKIHSGVPSMIPSYSPSKGPSLSPSSVPSSVPSISPSLTHSTMPTRLPSKNPSSIPSSAPSLVASISPSLTHSVSPSRQHSDDPSMAPSLSPSLQPTQEPSTTPTKTASSSPTLEESLVPSLTLSSVPSYVPSALPSLDPTSRPSEIPSLQISTPPTLLSSQNPTDRPSLEPSVFPSIHPSNEPTVLPSKAPTMSPSSRPTNEPSPQPSSVPSESKPNMIMIMTDEHNLRTLSCYRNYLLSKYPKESVDVWGKNVHLDTPNIDSLARDGALFTNFYTVAPLCTPSRSSFLTGLYPQFTGGADQNHGKLGKDILTWSKILKENGYVNAYMGKFHLDGEEKPLWNAEEGRDFGFDFNKYRFNRGHWKYFDEVNNSPVEYLMEDEDKFQGRYREHYATDFLFDRGLEYIERRVSKQEPFSLVLSISDPHSPNENRPYFRNLYSDLDFDYPETGRKNMKFDPAPPSFNWINRNEVPIDEVDVFLEEYKERFFLRHMQQYFAMVKCIDFNMGKLLEKIESLGIEDDTMIIFTSDHGDLLGEHADLNKGKPFETSAGIPFIVKFPKVVSPKVIETAYSSVDFTPTILNLMGISKYKLPLGAHFQGVDGSAELKSKNTIVGNDDKIVFTMDTGNTPHWFAAIKKGFKLVLHKNDVPWLFDLNQDPDELQNYATSTSHKVIFDELLDASIPMLKDFQVPLTDITNVIFLDHPICIDSKDPIPLGNNKLAFCTDIGDDFSEDRCNNWNVRSHCPASCKECCHDSPGKIWINGSARFCHTLANQCRNKMIQTFCPGTCEVCDGNGIF